MRRAWLELRPEDGGNANAHEVSMGGSSEGGKSVTCFLQFSSRISGTNAWYCSGEMDGGEERIGEEEN